jgi:hypothetical protein
MIVLGAFTVAINSLHVSYTGYGTPSGWFSALGVIVICYAGATALPFISLYFAGALGKLSFFRRRINLTTVTWLYATTLCLSFYIGREDATSFCTNYGTFIANRIMSSPEVTLRLVPWFMAPPIDVANQIVAGGVPVPWADLLPMIIFWSIFTGIYGLLMLSIATLFRKHWIDIERVPFPNALAAYELLVKMVPEKRGKFTRPFLIGLILGIVVWIPVIGIALFPWFPDIYRYNVNTCGYGSYVVQPGDAIATIIGMARIGKEPLGVAIAYFAPLYVLFNTWFWWLILVILTQVAYMAGYYTGLTNVPGCCRVQGAEVAIPLLSHLNGKR